MEGWTGWREEERVVRYTSSKIFEAEGGTVGLNFTGDRL